MVWYCGGVILSLRRQVDPQLRHLQLAAAFGESLGMEFLMHDAGAGRHPLHITRTDGAAIAGGIAMVHFAAVDNGHGLEAAMRMLAHTALAFAPV